MTKKDLYGYLIHYNPFTDKWAAVPRGKEVAYFNGEAKEDETIIRANCITAILAKFKAV
jgi:hypothetical protein